MSNISCYYCIKIGHNGKDCPIFKPNYKFNSIAISNAISSSITNSNSGSEFGFKNRELIKKLLWQVSQEKNCLPKIQQIIRLAEVNNIKIDLTMNNNMSFRCACYQNDIEFAEFLLKTEPRINVRDLSDSAFVNACWENYLVGSHKEIILLLLREQPYVYSYSFETKEKKINTLKEERDARWKTKREFIMTSSHLKENDTIINKLPSELSRLVIEFLYKK